MQTKWIQIIKMLSFVIAFFVYIRKMKGEYSKNEIDIILDRFKDDDTFTCAFITSCFTGMRTGEVCSLTWDDIGFENRVINVRHTVYDKPKDDKGRWYIGTTKTKQGTRQINMSATLYNAILNIFYSIKCQTREM